MHLPRLCFPRSFSFLSEFISLVSANYLTLVLGEDCDELGVGAVVFIGLNIVSICVGVAGLYMTIRALIVLFKCDCFKKEVGFKNGLSVAPSASANAQANSSLKELQTRDEEPGQAIKRAISKKETCSYPAKPKKQRVFNSMSFTVFLCFMAFLMFTIWRLVILSIPFKPAVILLQEEEGINGEAKVPFIEKKIEQLVVIIFGAFFGVTTLNLSLVWIDNVHRVQKFSAKSKDNLLRYRWALVVVDLVWIILSITLDSSVQAVFIIIFLLSSTILYFVAEYKLKKLYKSMYHQWPTKSLLKKSQLSTDTGSKQMASYWLEVLILRMIKARRRVAFSCVLSVIGASIYVSLVVVTHWREFSPSGSVSIPMLGNELMSIGAGLYLLSIAAFLFTTAVRPLKKRSQHTTAV